MPAPTTQPVQVPAPDPKGLPVPGAPAAPPAAPAKPPPLRVQFNRSEIDVDPYSDEGKKYIQLGMKADKLEQRAAQIKSMETQQNAELQAGRLLSQMAQSDPNGFAIIKDVLAGRADRYLRPQAPAAPGQGQAPSDDDGGLTGDEGANRLLSEVAQKLTLLDARLQNQERTTHQRDRQSSLERALQRPGLRATPEAAELAQLLVPALEHEFDGNLDLAAQAAEGTIKRLLEGHLRSERERREATRENAPLPSMNGGAPMPMLDRQKLTYKELKSGGAVAHLRDLVARARAAVSGPNP
jgi:hypothetical protein